jgi:HSP20 family protein
MTKSATSPTTTEIETPTRNELWSQMDRLFDEFRDDLFSAVWPTPFLATPFPGMARSAADRATALPFVPALVDVEDKGTSYEVHAELPGIPKDKIDVQVHGNILQLHAESTSARNMEGKNYVRRERSYLGFHRAIELPEDVDADKVQARYQDGVLTVSVPKANPVTTRKVQVA